MTMDNGKLLKWDLYKAYVLLIIRKNKALLFKEKVKPFERENITNGENIIRFY